MKYITKKHKSRNMYLQYDENGKLMVVYLVIENQYTTLIDTVIVVEDPEYFLLPNIKRPNKDKFESDYVLKCSCFNGLKSVKLVCPGCLIKLSDNNYCDLELILSKGQALYGVVEKHRSVLPTEPYGCLYILDNALQAENYKEYIFGKLLTKSSLAIRKINYGFTSAPQFDSKCKVRIDRSVVYNCETNTFEETENYDENNMQNVFPDIEDELK